MRRPQLSFALALTLLLALPTLYVALPTGPHASTLAAQQALTASRGGSPRDLFPVLLAASRDRGSVSPRQSVTLALLLRDPSAARRAADLAAMYTPRTSRFGHYLTPQQLAAAYGPSASAVARLRALLRRQGLIAQWRRGDDWLLVSGPARQVEAAFGVRIHTYLSPQNIRFYASPRDPVVPRALRFIVSGAGHISSYLQPFPHAVPDGGLQPVDLLSAYDIKPLRDRGFDGSGETVAFFEWDGYTQSDLDTFTQKFSLPPMQPTIKVGPALAAGAETEMDMEVVHEIAPGAKLLLYNVDQSALRNASTAQFLSKVVDVQNTMVNDNPGAIISESWGFCEKALGAANAAPYKDIYDHADLLGETVFASTGDNGAFECLQFVKRGTPPATEYLGAVVPSVAPGVTAVGGTRLSVAIDKSWYNETVWEDPVQTGGGGGNVSAYFAMPSWQRSAGVANAQYNPTNLRQTPDVAADADPVSGAAIYIPGPNGSQWSLGGGTSQSAPIWAGITALINQYLKSKGLKGAGFLNPALYHLATTQQPFFPFHDVTMGTNLYYPATPGYDLATGWGTPDAWNIAQDLEQYQRSGGR